MITIRWLGAAGIELIAGDQAVLVDPYLSRPGKSKVAWGRLRSDPEAVRRYHQNLTQPIAALVAGHTHFDHALDIPALAAAAGDAPVIGSQSLDTLLGQHGLPERVTVCRQKKEIEVSENIRITMLPATHGRVALGRVPFPGEISPNWRPPLKSSQYRLGTMFMPEITLAGKSFIHAGSAGCLSPAITVSDCDVLFMCVPGWRRNPDYTGSMLTKLAPKMIIPFHFDDFTRPLRAAGKQPRLPFLNLTAFVKTIQRQAPQAEIRVLRPLEKVCLS
ncbi:MAG: MBL fold metallo-hydrolase [Desulfosudaceae bacterium]